MGDEEHPHALSSGNRKGVEREDEFSETGNMPYHHGQPPPTSGQERSSGSAMRPTILDMSNVAAALPEFTYRQPQSSMYQQQYPQPMQNPTIMYQYPGAQYSGGMPAGYSVPYPMHVHAQSFGAQRQYGQYMMQANAAGGNQAFPNQVFYHPQEGMPASVPGPYSPTSPGAGFQQIPGPMYAMRGPPQYPTTQMRMENYGGIAQSTQVGQHAIRRTSSASSLQTSSALRGPPRKPRQSGHALWVGNLPPGTNILDLKDHFAREATEDIESVFLISKSNCAFVNYRSDDSCSAAMSRFHDSRFNGVRLVCRLRRGSSPVPAVSPTVASPGASMILKTSLSDNQIEDTIGEEKDSSQQDEHQQETDKISERYFIIKSLTIEDLERSVHSGIWATQSHNENALNKAFRSAEHVFLIFSANKSGEYFGYARMDSPIDGETVPLATTHIPETQAPPQQPGSLSADLPLTIPTPATATAPIGYVIDDSARGTIFWEAESLATEIETNATTPLTGLSSSGDISDDESEPQPKPSSSGNVSQSTSFGKPFKITWMSTERLPFYRTRGLRNPWNTNREVKIARDGTELEPSIGRKLVAMFNSGTTTGRGHPQGQFLGMVTTAPGHGPAYRPF